MRMTRDENSTSTAHKFEMDSSSAHQLQQQQQQQQQQQHQNGGGGGGPNVGGGLGGGGGGVGLGLNNSGLGGQQLQQQQNNKQLGDNNHQDNNQQNNGGGGGGILVGSNGDHNQYTMPGVLHYIQHEFSRFEMERSQWDIDRAEFQARIAVLLGERKGQESLKSDLIRRIKMLEYALKQERAKFHRLKFGCDPPTMNDCKPPADGEPGSVGPGGVIIGSEVAPDSEVPFSSVSNTTWRQGRSMLRSYLQEIGYTDTIIDVRSNRVRAMLGLNNNAAGSPGGGGGGGGGVGEIGGGAGGAGGIGGDENASPSVNGNDNSAAPAGSAAAAAAAATKRSASDGSQGRRTPAKKAQSATVAEAEAAVMAALEFLEHTDGGMSESDDDDYGGMEVTDYDNDDVKPLKNRKTKVIKSEDVDAQAEEVLNELNLLSESEDSGMVGQLKSEEVWGQTIAYSSDTTARRPPNTAAACNAANAAAAAANAAAAAAAAAAANAAGGVDEDVDAALGLGELAQLSVNNEDEVSTYDATGNAKETHRKTWNAKYTLRSHFDGVRALAFHPQEPVLITASEDHTLKLWNLQKTVLTKKSAGLDVEPLYTFRAHTGPVLCLTMSTNGEQCFSGGLDGAIFCWNLPSSNIDPYDSYDPKVLRHSLDGHTDAVWGLAYNHAQGQLVSCSADGTVKLWSPLAKQPLLNTYASEAEGVPSSVDFVRDEQDRIVVAYNTTGSHCIIYDTETGKPVCKLESPEMNAQPGRFINKVVSHPTLSISITAHEDRHIRFWDNGTGALMHSMVAHLEPVTSLAVDAGGLYLLSGSHDCSIRLWNLDNKTCVQEITAHRKKFDESIFDVAFHPIRAYIASAGADALSKVFV